MFSDVLDNHENMRLDIPHMGCKFREEMYQLVHDNPNAFSDISALQGWPPSNPDMVITRSREAVQSIPNRVLFGSDWPLFDLASSRASWGRFVKEHPWGESMGEYLGGRQHPKTDAMVIVRTGGVGPRRPRRRCPLSLS
jgi:predicted TIM-barrel fold metal-dependent hydrolase